jgi:quercetin 2,3-dioxygenase
MQHVLHRADDRGQGDYGWLQTRYSFSFADWYDPTRMGFGALRVLNDDVIAPGHGFEPHPHRNMEIITIVMKGAVSHRDSMGNEYTIPAGDVQVMSAGTGVVHAEYNYSPDTSLALFQVWIEPRTLNLQPRYSQKAFGVETVRNTLTVLAAPVEDAGALVIQQDAFVSSGTFEAGALYTYHLHRPGNGVYVFVVEGTVLVEQETLNARDAVGIREVDNLSLSFTQPTHLLLFEIPFNNSSNN